MVISNSVDGIVVRDKVVFFKVEDVIWGVFGCFLFFEPGIVVVVGDSYLDLRDFLIDNAPGNEWMDLMSGAALCAATGVALSVSGCLVSSLPDEAPTDPDCRVNPSASIGFPAVRSIGDSGTF